MYTIQIQDEVMTYEIVEDQLVERSAELVEQERQAALEAKRAEVQAKVDAYVAAQQHQLQHGGPGPSAEFEIMKIVNEYNAQFEIVFKQN